MLVAFLGRNVSKNFPFCSQFRLRDSVIHPLPILVPFFGEKIQKNILYDELYQILAGLPTVLIDLSGAKETIPKLRLRLPPVAFGGWKWLAGILIDYCLLIIDD